MIVFVGFTFGFSVNALAIGFSDPNKSNKKQGDQKAQVQAQAEKSKKETQCKNLKAELDPNNVFAKKLVAIEADEKAFPTKIETAKKSRDNLKTQETAFYTNFVAPYENDKSGTTWKTNVASHEKLKKLVIEKENEVTKLTDEQNKIKSMIVGHKKKLVARQAKLEQTIKKLDCK